MRAPSLPGIAALLVLLSFTGCVRDNKHHLLISTADQKMVVLREGQLLTVYPVSTSKFGLGDQPGSNATPLGKMRIRKKIGEGVPAGAVFKSRKLTGEILPPNAPGRDPIVTRILWLEGLEPQNENAFDRYIYIHGTPEESTIGTPASFGCVRMKSQDIIELFETVGPGARVTIQTAPFPRLAPESN